MRPISIVWFARLYALSVLLGLVQSVTLVAALNTAQGNGGLFVATTYLAMAIGTAIPVLLWWLVARRGSDVARWIVTALVALSLVGTVLALVRGTFALNLFGGIGLVQRALAIAAVAMTFRADAQAWLVTRRAEA